MKSVHVHAHIIPLEVWGQAGRWGLRWSKCSTAGACDYVRVTASRTKPVPDNDRDAILG